jgi:hypothetical protein
MKFKSIDELNKYIKENHSDISTVDITFALNESNECIGCKLTESLRLTTLCEAPEVLFTETDGDNEIYVTGVDVIKDACGTGSLNVLGRTVLTNVCESGNIIHVNLDVEVKGKEYNKIPFVVKIAEKDEYIKLNIKTLK